MELETGLTTIGNERAQRVLRAMIGVFEMVFPERIRATYVDGSYADGTEVTTSDLAEYVLHWSERD